MTSDDIIRIAREAGLQTNWITETGVLRWSELKRFATLVAAAERERLESSIHSCGPHCSRPACVATRRAVDVERERLRAMLVRHRDQTRISHHVTLAECHAAKNALQLVLDEWS